MPRMGFTDVLLLCVPKSPEWYFLVLLALALFLKTMADTGV